MKGYMGNKPTKADMQDKIPYTVPVLIDGKRIMGTVSGRELDFPIVTLHMRGQFQVSWDCLIRQWETGAPLRF